MNQSSASSAATSAAAAVSSSSRHGLAIQSKFSKMSLEFSALDDFVWERRDVKIEGDGGTVFAQKDVEVPHNWSQLALQVTASKYFRGSGATREDSVRKLIERVVGTITEWGRVGGYFKSRDDGTRFYNELAHMVAAQMFAFNSPVWFNVGVENRPQCSACFINSVDDSMDSILTLAKTEGMLFKYGSGTGSNLSRIRSSKEKLNGGGDASGPVSFMMGFDAFAGAIKSGGKTRRAAKMVILNADHPDIFEFIECKANAERIARALIAAGFNPKFNGTSNNDAYKWTPFQNANNSVRVTDEFMRRAVGTSSEESWDLCDRNGRTVETVDAAHLLDAIAQAAWESGDPGMQFDTTINEWHTCADTTRINASNPCSEYMFIDDSACNLGSLNLMKFRNADGTLDVEAFRHAVDIALLAMEIIVNRSSYPTEKIEENSREYRPLGLGYANLGAFIMASGYAYDSDEGRELAAAITALMHCRAYTRSGQIAKYATGPFTQWYANKDSFLRVLQKHNDALYATHLNVPGKFDYLITAARADASSMLHLAQENGVCNAQVTVLAPTGTIGFMMDCDTTGIEPDFALVKTKHLVGGGKLKIVNQSIPLALQRLGYTPGQVSEITDFIVAHNTVEGAPHLKESHYDVFDCAVGKRAIPWRGHIDMMAAVQPFLSGAISKTVNMPEDATVGDIRNAYHLAWASGLKAVAIYRDGCKQSQPLETNAGKSAAAAAAAVVGTCQLCNDQITSADAIHTPLLGAPIHLRCHRAANKMIDQVASPEIKAEVDAIRKMVASIRDQRVVELPSSEPSQCTNGLDCMKCLKTLKEKDVSIHIPGKGNFHLGCYQPSKPARRKLPSTRPALAHKFKIADHTGYLHVGLFDDGTFGEMFVGMNKEGSVVSGLMDALSTAVSVGVQYGVPVTKFIEKFSYMSFEPSGFTGNEQIPMAKSILDYVFRWIDLNVVQKDARELLGARPPAIAAGSPGAEPKVKVEERKPYAAPSVKTTNRRSDAPPCHSCGEIMIRNGACYKCSNCGSTSGCS